MLRPSILSDGSTARCHGKVVTDAKGCIESIVNSKGWQQRSCHSEKQSKEWNWEPRDSQTVGRSKAEVAEVETHWRIHPEAHSLVRHGKAGYQQRGKTLRIVLNVFGIYISDPG